MTYDYESKFVIRCSSREEFESVTEFFRNRFPNKWISSVGWEDGYDCLLYASETYYAIHPRTFKQVEHQYSDIYSAEEFLRDSTASAQEAKFKVGDKVRMVECGWDRVPTGAAGRIIEVRTTDVCVEYEQRIDGHDGDGTGRFGYCWYSSPTDLEKLEEVSTDESVTVNKSAAFPFTLPESVFDYKPIFPTLFERYRPFLFENGAIINEPMAQKETTQMQVIKAIKAKLSPVDRTLVKNGYLTSTGERTGKYDSELWESIQAELIAEADTKEFRKELAAALSDEE